MSYQKFPIAKFCFILFFIIPNLICSQSANDKLRAALDKFMITENPKDGIRDLLILKDLVADTSDSLQGHYYLNLGIAYGQLNHADSSFWALDKAEKLAVGIESDFLLSMVNNTRGLVYMGKADYEASVAAYQEVMRIAEGKNNKELYDVLSKTYGNLGGVYYQLGQIDKALETTKKCLALSESIQDTTDIALNHLRLAMVYSEMNQLDNGITHLNIASTFFKGINNTAMLVHAENNLGKIYRKKNQLDIAFEHYQLAYDYSKSLGEQEEYISTLLAMSSVKLEQNKLNEAERYARTALDLSKERGFANSELNANNLLYEITLKANKISEALSYRNAYVLLNDSLNNIEVKERVASLETQFETAKKEKEIQKLTYESQLKDANLAKARSGLIAIIVGALTSIAMILVFFITKQKKDKAERIAQAMQVEALQKRFMELHSSPSELSVNLNMEELNHKLQESLTEREFETLKLCIAGNTNSEIADQLHVTVSTVKFHLRNAYSKLGVNNRKEAFRFMLKSI